MPGVRDYPEFTGTQPTDAFPVDRIGVGSGFIEAHNIPLTSTVVVSSTGINMVTGTFYAVKTSEGAFTLNLPAVSTLTDPAYLEVADIDFNGDVNNITIDAAGSDQIYLYGVLQGSQATMDVAGEWARFVAEDGVWAMFVGPFSVSGSGTTAVAVSPSLDPIPIVALQSSANLANPNITDPSLTNPAYTDQIYRAWQSSNGALTAQSVSSFPNLCAMRRFPVTNGQTYTININGAPLGYILYFTSSPKISFYDSSHAFTSSITSFTMYPSVNPRQATFVAPNTGYVGINVEDTSTGNAIPTTQAALDATINAFMMNTGSTALPYVPYFNGTFAPTDAIFQPPLAGQVVVALQVGYAYVRTACQQSADTDICRRILLGETPNILVEGVSGSSPGGTVDPSGFRFIPKSTPVINTIEAYNSATVCQSGTDESVPVVINGMGVGGNHATISYKVTVAAGHGKTAVDVGSVYADATPTNWIIGAYISSTVLVMEIENSGTSTAWNFSGAINGSTFTHVSGGTNTANFSFTSPTLTELSPLNARYVMEMVLDGTVLYTTAYSLVATAGNGNTGNGTVTGSGLPPALPGNYTLTFTSGTAFGVTDPNGATVGTGALPASSSGSTVTFSAGGLTLVVTAGSTAFVNTDSFTIVATQTYTGTDGVYAGSELAINEVYSVLNPASQQTSLIANVGANPPNYQRSDITEQLRCFYQWIFNPWGAMTVGGSAINNVQAFNRNGPTSGFPCGDYWGGEQLQRFNLDTDLGTPGIATNVELYIPNTPNPIAGYSFQDFADITTPPVAPVPIPIADCGDPSNPPNHFCQRALETGTILWSECYGIDMQYELGVPATAIANKANVLWFGTTQKQYPVLIDAYAGNGVAGVTQMVGATFRAPFLPTDSALSIPGVIVDMNGVRYCYIAAHQNLTRHSVAVPSALNGETITTLQAAGSIEIVSRIVQNSEILITVTGGYGDAVLQIGASA